MIKWIIVFITGLIHVVALHFIAKWIDLDYSILLATTALVLAIKAQYETLNRRGT